jgi:hypothetical protein
MNEDKWMVRDEWRKRDVQRESMEGGSVIEGEGRR